MKLHLFFSILATLLLTACGGGSSSSTNSISSFSKAKETLEANGYSLEELQKSSNVQTKASKNELHISYEANKSITLSTSLLYVVTNENNESIVATLDANATTDGVEKKTKLHMEHQIFKTLIGYVNINTTTTNKSATKETVLAEVEQGFKQFTLHNVTAPTTVVENNDINISYQTALQNQDKTFTCNGETKVVDAQRDILL